MATTWWSASSRCPGGTYTCTPPLLARSGRSARERPQMLQLDVWSRLVRAAMFHSMTATATATRRARLLMPGAFAGLLLADVTGGLVDVSAGRSRLDDAR